MKLIIIGAGPAGMMASIQAAKKGHEVVLIEKNEELGKKLNITGKGRCNITYEGDNEYFLENVVTNAKFMMSSINHFNNNDLLTFLYGIGIKTKKERGNRYFLSSDNAKELTLALKKELNRLKVKIMFNTTVEKITLNSKEKRVKEVEIKNKQKTLKIEADNVLIATGGLSYPSTGSSGDGYDLAKFLGHNIIEPKPALVAMKLYEENDFLKLEGLTLKNIKIKILELEKVLDERFGELIFTSKGVSGPIILSSSSKINKEENIVKKASEKQIVLQIDLKPALTKDKLYKRITKDFEKYSNKEYKNGLKDLLPKSIIPVVIKRTGIDENKKINIITKEEKLKIVEILKSFVFTISGFENITTGIVTSGGVSVKEINPKTMESKIVKGLFFAGEVIDVDAYTGGFNLQIAFSTGFSAGINMGG